MNDDGGRSEPGSTSDPLQITKAKALKFKEELTAIRGRTRPDNGLLWYPWDTIANFWHLDVLLKGDRRRLFERLDGLTVADIGAADGDLGFFLSTLGARVDMFDQPATNMNQMSGMRTLKRELNLPVDINEIDIDDQFRLAKTYDVAVFLGILYHLKNPFYALEHLARRARVMLLSTRIAGELSPGGPPIVGPLAYLLSATESENGDSTNYWIFNEESLKRLLVRTGWKVVDFCVVGQAPGDPWSVAGDARAFCYAESLAFSK